MRTKLIVLCLCFVANLSAQTLMSDTLLFVFKLHGQTRKYEIVFHEKKDTLYLDWRILRNLHWQRGRFIMERGSVEEGNSLTFLQPEDGKHVLLSSQETAYVLSKKAYKQLKETGEMEYNQTKYSLLDKEDCACSRHLLHVKDKIEGAEMWILDDEKLPLVWKMSNNPLNINWRVELSKF